jgi:hypothetical protein
MKEMRNVYKTLLGKSGGEETAQNTTHKGSIILKWILRMWIRLEPVAGL